MDNIEELKGFDYYDFLKALNKDVDDKELFISKYTRKDCVRILNRLNKYTCFRSITKERAYKHIRFWFELHF